MSYVMIAYCHSDRKFVDNLAEALGQRNIRVRYDTDLILGDDYRRKIGEWIEGSYAVLVVWSDAACESTWVIDEAEDARTRRKLLQIAISKNCKLPKPFGAYHCGDLTSWDGTPNHFMINKIVDAVTELADCGRAKQPKIECDDDVALDLAEVRSTLRDRASIDVLKFLGHGQISDVYQGRCGTRLVSIKAIVGAKLSDSDRQTLSRETEAASGLHHPSFMPLYRTIFDNRRCFIVMDYTDGETIEHAMTRGDGFSIGDVVEIVSQLSEAVAEAHERGMQHLRIIPSEIFVEMDKALHRKIVRIAPINFT
jgi:predicted Ser/Thr protein kinase